MDTTRHAGKVAIVTGAGNGIGRATVARFASEGATVIGCDINPDTLEETRALLAAAGLSAELVVADVTEAGERRRPGSRP